MHSMYLFAELDFRTSDEAQKIKKDIVGCDFQYFNSTWRQYDKKG